MKLLFDLFPVILFFASFKFAGANPQACADALNAFLPGAFDVAQAPILTATTVAIVASLVQVLAVFLKGKKPEPMLWISLGVILVFGTLTIALHNEMFIKWKPTILYWIFGAILLYGIATGKNFMTMLLKKQLTLPKECWDATQKIWCVFFAFVGLVNLAVAYLCSTDTWVNFKMFGLLGITFVFTLGFGIWMSKHLPEEKVSGSNNHENAYDCSSFRRFVRT